MAEIALIFWPVLAPLIFARGNLVSSVLIATIVPYLFLPEAISIELPGIPDLDKTAAISIGVIAGLLFYGSRAKRSRELPELETGSRRLRFLLFALVATILLGSLLTVANNREVLVFGPTVLPAMRPWDAIALFGGLTFFLIPFFVARRFLATANEHRALLKALVFGALVYSVLMLVELRLSPQLHVWVYGYHQHSFLQHIRDGYRPMVFLQHGLWVGFFIFSGMIAAAALWKSERDNKWLFAGGWIFLILMVSKNLGAFAICLMCLAILFGFRRKMQILSVILIAGMTLTFPALRQASLIPTDQILSVAESISEERARSLEFRLRHEDQLLARAAEKPLTGWGGWARDRIYNEYGEDTSVTDGRWIITLGGWGWIGYVGLFGLLTLPLLSLMVISRRKEIPHETIGLALICAGNLIYLIPNATLTPVGMLCFGAMAGFSQFDEKKQAVDPESDPVDDRRLAHRYTRFPHAAKRGEGRSVISTSR